MNPYVLYYNNLTPNLVADSNVRFRYDYYANVGSFCPYSCNGQVVNTCYQDPSVCQNFSSEKLVANQPSNALHLDVNLSDPWGILIVNNVIWVANSGSGLITSYKLDGKPMDTIINVLGPIDNISTPTGLASNKDISLFVITKNRKSRPATFLVATIDGTIHGYNSEVDPRNALLVVNNSPNGSVYKGLTLADGYLYVADFYNGVVDVYDGEFKRVTNFPFVDEYSADPIPDSYAPYNIVHIGGLLYVLYAKRDPGDSQKELHGMGNGYISIFSKNGVFIRRFVSRGVLDTPWGMIPTPSSFGFPPGAMMVSNFGNGIINIFDYNGNWLGSLKDKNGNSICISGIRSLATSSNGKSIYISSSSDFSKNSFISIVGEKIL
ncbi:MAG: TIGR03118 family protein [Thermoplasmata archaeon]